MSRVNIDAPNYRPETVPPIRPQFSHVVINIDEPNSKPDYRKPDLDNTDYGDKLPNVPFRLADPVRVR